MRGIAALLFTVWGIRSGTAQVHINKHKLSQSGPVHSWITSSSNVPEITG